MSKVIRLNDNAIDNLKEYYDLLSKRYSKDCSFLPDQDDLSRLISSAIIDAISYERWQTNTFD